jgi:hypothetical protein
MVERSVMLVEQVQVKGDAHGKMSGQCREELPLEVVTLLEVFARIEVRRRARLRDECKEVK